MQLQVNEDCIIAVTGREATLDVDGNAKATYQSQHVPAGATITFGSALLGSKASASAPSTPGALPSTSADNYSS